MDQETYEKQKAFAGEKVPSMHRRMVGHDYQERQMYMITMVTEDRRPLLGQVVGRSDGQPGSPDLPRTLHYGGTDHHLMLKLNSQTYFLLSKASLDAGKPFANQSVFQFTVDGIYEGHTLLQAFDDWQDNSAEYLTYFQFE